jgi:hypothetical protein
MIHGGCVNVQHAFVKVVQICYDHLTRPFQPGRLFPAGAGTNVASGFCNKSTQLASRQPCWHSNLLYMAGTARHSC